LESNTTRNDILRYQNMIKMKSDAKICNCWHVTKCDKNTKNPKSPIGFCKSQGPPHHEDKKVWSHHIYAIGSKTSPFYRGETQTFLFPFFTLHQIWLNPIVGDHQPTWFTNLKKKTLAKTSKMFTLKLIIEILYRSFRKKVSS
jgi:hypothetical protein